MTTEDRVPSTVPLPQTFTDGKPLPKVLVFDLDYTLWPFWIDTHVTPPLKVVTGGGSAKDRYGETLAFYNEVPGILAACRSRDIKVAAASRTSAPDLARQLLGMLRIEELDAANAKAKAGGGGKLAKDFFDNMQIYPGNKVRHLTTIHNKLGINYEDMLFFDDESRNRNVERELGVCFKLVPNGVSRKEIDAGIDKWRRVRGLAKDTTAGSKAPASDSDEE